MSLLLSFDHLFCISNDYNLKYCVVVVFFFFNFSKISSIPCLAHEKTGFFFETNAVAATPPEGLTVNGFDLGIVQWQQPGSTTDGVLSPHPPWWNLNRAMRCLWNSSSEDNPLQQGRTLSLLHVPPRRNLHMGLTWEKSTGNAFPTSLLGFEGGTNNLSHFLSL